VRVEKTLTVTATEALTVTITPTPSRGYVGTTFIFTVNWTPILPGPFDVDIDYGDGVTGRETGVLTPPTYFHYAYTVAGSYTVRVVVTDTYTGGKGYASVTVEVSQVLTVSFSADKLKGMVPLSITFTIGIIGGYAPYSYTLDFGDGTAPASGTRTAPGPFTVTHTYREAGTFTAKVTVSDALESEVSAEIMVTPGVPVPLPLPWIAAPLFVGSVALATLQI